MVNCHNSPLISGAALIASLNIISFELIIAGRVCMEGNIIHFETIITNTPSFLLFICLCVYVGSFVFVFYSIPNAIRAKNFPTVIGTITSGGVSSSKLGIGQSAEDRLNVHQVCIEYVYRVDGVTHKAYKRVWHEFTSSYQAYHQRIAARYPQGKEVVVYYDPKNPKSAVLEPGVCTGAFLGLVLALAAMWFMYFFITHQYS
jgi:hypothetical protein